MSSHYHRNSRESEQEQQYVNKVPRDYQPRYEATRLRTVPPPASNIMERVDVPNNLQAWASGKEIQSILFKVRCRCFANANSDLWNR
jgi:hypothetical protein